MKLLTLLNRKILHLIAVDSRDSSQWFSGVRERVGVWSGSSRADANSPLGKTPSVTHMSRKCDAQFLCVRLDLGILNSLVPLQSSAVWCSAARGSWISTGSHAMHLEVTPQFSSLCFSLNTSSTANGSSHKSGIQHPKLVKFNAFHVFTFETPCQRCVDVKNWLGLGEKGCVFILLMKTP